jgi:diguanylate cyclase (GGDEF)-like protein
MSVAQRSGDVRRVQPASADAIVDTLTGAVRALAAAQSTEEVQRVVAPAARALTGADAATLVLRDSDECEYLDEDSIEPLWKGRRFPLDSCVTGWTMLNGRDAVIPDIHADRRVHDAYRKTFVESLATVPIRTVDPLGSIGVYWGHRHRATEHELGLARALADSTAVALEHVQTVAEPGALRLAEIDPLTGLRNLRAWDNTLADAIRAGAERLCVAVIELDHLAERDEHNGTAAADRRLRDTARAWTAALREGDMLARAEGVEFLLLLPDCDARGALNVAERLRHATPGEETASVGLACWDGEEDGESLIGRAHAALHEARGAGRDRTVLADE